MTRQQIHSCSTIPKTKLNWYILIAWSHSGGVFGALSSIWNGICCRCNWVNWSSNMWCPLKCHAYLSKTAVKGFGGGGGGGGRYAHLWDTIHYPGRLALPYSVWWPVGWCAYLKQDADFVDYVLHFIGRSVLHICPSVSNVHWNVTHTQMKLPFCLSVCSRLLTLCIMHFML